MNLVCPQCRARLSVAVDRVPPEGRRGRCTQCGGTFFVRPPNRGLAQTDPAGVTLAAPPEPPVPLASLETWADEFPDFPLADPGALAAPPATPLVAVPAMPPAATRSPLPAPSLSSALPLSPAPPPAAPRAQGGAAESDPLAATVHLAAGALAGATQRTYRWRREPEVEATLERRDVIRLIRDGSLGHDDELAEGNGSFRPAGELEDLRRYFQMREAPMDAPSPVRSSGPLLGCANHPATHAAWCCGMCGSYWCAACALPKRVANTTVTMCARCSEPCMPVAAPVEVVPFWKEIGSLFTYPVKGWGAAMWLMYAAMSWISGFMWLAGLLLFFFLTTYSMLIVKDSAEGNRKVPDWPDFSQWWEVIARGFRGVACSVIACLPLIAFIVFLFKFGGTTVDSAEGLARLGIWAVIGGLPLLLFTVVYYPMVFLIASVFDTITPALNPILIFKAIARVPFDYTIALIFIGVLAVTGVVLSIPFRFIPIVGGLPAAIVNTYFTFMWLHVLGRMGHQCEARLNWTV